MSICFKCNQIIKPASLASTVAGEKYHPTCIQCAICNKPVWGKPFRLEKKGKKNIITCQEPCNTPPESQKFYDQNISSKNCKNCGRPIVFNKRHENDEVCLDCYSNQGLKFPRIKTADYIACAICHGAVKGTEYFTKATGEIVCIKCDSLFKINQGNQSNEQSYNCYVCHSPIQQFEIYTSPKGLPICYGCYEISQMLKCASCAHQITDSFVLFENKPFHRECFKCKNCGNILNPKGFSRDKSSGEPVCTNCGQNSNVPKCSKCAQILDQDSIPYGELFYHRNCFRCDRCDASLLRSKTVYPGKDNKGLKCESCSKDFYAPRCEKCLKTIQTNSPSAKAQNMEFHMECFNCFKCKKPLTGKKFIWAGHNLICQNCL